MFDLLGLLLSGLLPSTQNVQALCTLLHTMGRGMLSHPLHHSEHALPAGVRPAT